MARADDGQSKHASPAIKGRTDLGSTLADQARGRLRLEILTGVRKPGETVSINQLAPVLGISRTPVREAMENLVLRRLVIWYGANGAVIMKVSEAELLECFRVLFAIESQVATVFASSNDVLRGLLLAQTLDQIDCIFPGDSPLDSASGFAFFESDVSFHCKMAELADMKLAAHFLSISYDLIRLFNVQFIDDPRAANMEHRAIVAAIRDPSGKANLVHAAVRDHVLGACGRLAPAIVPALESSL